MLGVLFFTIPTGFVPNEDQGYLINVVSMPEGTSLSRTEAVTETAETIALKQPAIDLFFSLTGYSFIDGLNRTTQSSNFLILKDWSERTTPENQAPAVLNTLAAAYKDIPEGALLLFNPPSIHGLGTVGGLEFWIQNKGSSATALEETTEAFLSAGAQTSRTDGTFLHSQPQRPTGLYQSKSR